ncbi:MAG: chromate transporter [Clostridia bacterium]|nr:chromate transporter [Clostridia bacterium]
MFWSQLWQVFVAFLQAGLLGFGGGPGVVPFIKQQVVDVHGWLSDAGFADALAFGNALPGPIATKLAAYVGYQVAGWAGAGAALLASFGPTALAMLAIFELYQRYKDSPYVAGALTGVKPVVVALLFAVAIDIGRGSFPNPAAWAIGALSLVALLWLHVNPAIVIAAALALGAALRL